MKILVTVLAVAVSLGLAVSGALAFTCPVLQKAANESISKAEQAAGKMDAQAKDRAMAMIEVAKGLEKQSEENHKKAIDTKDAKLHYPAEAQAKAAKALADLVK